MEIHVKDELTFRLPFKQAVLDTKSTIQLGISNISVTTYVVRKLLLLPSRTADFRDDWVST